MDVVFAVADRIMVLHQGRVIADGPPAAVRADPQVQARLPGRGRVSGPAGSPDHLDHGQHADRHVDYGEPEDLKRHDSPPMKDALELDGVDAVYGRWRVLHGVTLTARAGEVVSLLGRNGAGKSTTLKAIVGLVEVTGGAIRFDGRAITRPADARDQPRRGRATCRRTGASSPTSPCDENLTVGARRARPASGAMARVYAVLSQARWSWPGRRAGSLSGGEQQMLTIARTLMGNPPRAAARRAVGGPGPGDRAGRSATQIAALKREGLTILLSEQNLKFAARLADRAYIIEKGEIRFDGPIAQLMADEALRRKYLTV